MAVKEIAAIRLPQEELARWTFVAPEQATALARRIAACLRVIDSGTAMSLQDGYST